ncbi:unnamed protein product [Closterium sp. NIES-64]|nr:unnamed protein product [Closterium sp. NIES-64]
MPPIARKKKPGGGGLGAVRLSAKPLATWSDGSGATDASTGFAHQDPPAPPAQHESPQSVPRGSHAASHALPAAIDGSQATRTHSTVGSQPSDSHRHPSIRDVHPADPLDVLLPESAKQHLLAATDPAHPPRATAKRGAIAASKKGLSQSVAPSSSNATSHATDATPTTSVVASTNRSSTAHHQPSTATSSQAQGAVPPAFAPAPRAAASAPHGASSSAAGAAAAPIKIIGLSGKASRSSLVKGKPLVARSAITPSPAATPNASNNAPATAASSSTSSGRSVSLSTLTGAPFVASIPANGIPAAAPAPSATPVALPMSSVPSNHAEPAASAFLGFDDADDLRADAPLAPTRPASSSAAVAAPLLPPAAVPFFDSPLASAAPAPPVPLAPASPTSSCSSTSSSSAPAARKLTSPRLGGKPAGKGRLLGAVPRRLSAPQLSAASSGGGPGGEKQAQAAEEQQARDAQMEQAREREKQRQLEEESRKEREQQERERLEQLRKEEERRERERLEEERREKERKEKERQDQLRVERERKEKERLERLRAEQERKQREREAQLKAEQERKEKEERLEQLRLEQEREEKERLDLLQKEEERREMEKQEQLRIEREKEEREEQEKTAKEMQERMEKERIERERLEKERLEKERLDKEKREEREREEKVRKELERRQKEEQEQQRRKERERKEKLKAERERLEWEKREQERIEEEKKEQERRKEQERKERERQEELRKEEERKERERHEWLRREEERKKKDRQEQLRRERERREQERQERLEQQRREREQKERERQEMERRERERQAEEQAQEMRKQRTRPAAEGGGLAGSACANGREGPAGYAAEGGAKVGRTHADVAAGAAARLAAGEEANGEQRKGQSKKGGGGGHGEGWAGEGDGWGSIDEGEDWGIADRFIAESPLGERAYARTSSFQGVGSAAMSGEAGAQGLRQHGEGWGGLGGGAWGGFGVGGVGARMARPATAGGRREGTWPLLGSLVKAASDVSAWSSDVLLTAQPGEEAGDGAGARREGVQGGQDGQGVLGGGGDVKEEGVGGAVSGRGGDGVGEDNESKIRSLFDKAGAGREGPGAKLGSQVINQGALALKGLAMPVLSMLGGAAADPATAASAAPAAPAAAAAADGAKPTWGAASAAGFASWMGEGDEGGESAADVGAKGGASGRETGGAGGRKQLGWEDLVSMDFGGVGEDPDEGGADGGASGEVGVLAMLQRGLADEEEEDEDEEEEEDVMAALASGSAVRLGAPMMASVASAVSAAATRLLKATASEEDAAAFFAAVDRDAVRPAPPAAAAAALAGATQQLLPGVGALGAAGSGSAESGPARVVEGGVGVGGGKSGEEGGQLEEREEEDAAAWFMSADADTDGDADAGAGAGTGAEAVGADLVDGVDGQGEATAPGVGSDATALDTAVEGGDEGAGGAMVSGDGVEGGEGQWSGAGDQTVGEQAWQAYEDGQAGWQHASGGQGEGQYAGQGEGQYGGQVEGQYGGQGDGQYAGQGELTAEQWEEQQRQWAEAYPGWYWDYVAAEAAVGESLVADPSAAWSDAPQAEAWQGAGEAMAGGWDGAEGMHVEEIRQAEMVEGDSAAAGTSELQPVLMAEGEQGKEQAESSVQEGVTGVGGGEQLPVSPALQPLSFDAAPPLPLLPDSQPTVPPLSSELTQVGAGMDSGEELRVCEGGEAGGAEVAEERAAVTDAAGMEVGSAGGVGESGHDAFDAEGGAGQGDADVRMGEQGQMAGEAAWENEQQQEGHQQVEGQGVEAAAVGESGVIATEYPGWVVDAVTGEWRQVGEAAPTAADGAGGEAAGGEAIALQYPGWRWDGLLGQWVPDDRPESSATGAAADGADASPDLADASAGTALTVEAVAVEAVAVEAVGAETVAEGAVAAGVALSESTAGEQEWVPGQEAREPVVEGSEWMEAGGEEVVDAAAGEEGMRVAPPEAMSGAAAGGAEVDGSQSEAVATQVLDSAESGIEDPAGSSAEYLAPEEQVLSAGVEALEAQGWEADGAGSEATAAGAVVSAFTEGAETARSEAIATQYPGWMWDPLTGQWVPTGEQPAVAAESAAADSATAGYAVADDMGENVALVGAEGMAVGGQAGGAAAVVAGEGWPESEVSGAAVDWAAEAVEGGVEGSFVGFEAEGHMVSEAGGEAMEGQAGSAGGEADGKAEADGFADVGVEAVAEAEVSAPEVDEVSEAVVGTEEGEGGQHVGEEAVEGWTDGLQALDAVADAAAVDAAVAAAGVAASVGAEETAAGLTAEAEGASVEPFWADAGPAEGGYGEALGVGAGGAEEAVGEGGAGMAAVVAAEAEGAEAGGYEAIATQYPGWMWDPLTGQWVPTGEQPAVADAAEAADAGGEVEVTGADAATAAVSGCEEGDAVPEAEAAAAAAVDATVTGAAIGMGESDGVFEEQDLSADSGPAVEPLATEADACVPEAAVVAEDIAGQEETAGQEGLAGEEGTAGAGGVFWKEEVVEAAAVAAPWEAVGGSTEADFGDWGERSTASGMGAEGGKENAGGISASLLRAAGEVAGAEVAGGEAQAQAQAQAEAEAETEAFAVGGEAAGDGVIATEYPGWVVDAVTGEWRQVGEATPAAADGAAAAEGAGDAAGSSSAAAAGGEAIALQYPGWRWDGLIGQWVPDDQPESAADGAEAVAAVAAMTEGEAAETAAVEALGEAAESSGMEGLGGEAGVVEGGAEGGVIATEYPGWRWDPVVGQWLPTDEQVPSGAGAAAAADEATAAAVEAVSGAGDEAAAVAGSVVTGGESAGSVGAEGAGVGAAEADEWAQFEETVPKEGEAEGGAAADSGSAGASQGEPGMQLSFEAAPPLPGLAPPPDSLAPATEDAHAPGTALAASAEAGGEDDAQGVEAGAASAVSAAGAIAGGEMAGGAGAGEAGAWAQQDWSQWGQTEYDAYNAWYYQQQQQAQEGEGQTQATEYGSTEAVAAQSAAAAGVNGEAVAAEGASSYPPTADSLLAPTSSQPLQQPPVSMQPQPFLPAPAPWGEGSAAEVQGGSSYPGGSSQPDPGYGPAGSRYSQPDPGYSQPQLHAPWVPGTAGKPAVGLMVPSAPYSQQQQQQQAQQSAGVGGYAQGYQGYQQGYQYGLYDQHQQQYQPVQYNHVPPTSTAEAVLSSAGRPPHTLLAFGFGGRAAVVVPGSSLGQTMGSQGQVEVRALLELLLSILESMQPTLKLLPLPHLLSLEAHDGVSTATSTAGSLYLAPLTGKHAHNGPLTAGGMSAKELSKWLEERAERSGEEEEAEAGGGGGAGGAERAESLVLLWRVLRVACQFYGQLRRDGMGSRSAQGESSPEAELAKVLAAAGAGPSTATAAPAAATAGPFPSVAAPAAAVAPMAPYASAWSPLPAAASAAARVSDLQLPIPTEAAVQAAAQEVKQHLVAGRHMQALEAAKAGHLWGLALLLAQHMGGPSDTRLFLSTAQAMAAQQFAPGAPLRTLTLLLTQQPSAVFASAAAAATGAAADATKTGVGAGAGTGTAAGGDGGTSSGSSDEGVRAMVAEWRENVALMAATRTSGDERVISHLGDCLWRLKGDVAAAHICYLVAAGSLEPFSSSARMCLLGTDHLKHPRTFVTAQAIQRSEVLEYAFVLGNPQFVLLPLMPFKLVYAAMLAEAGRPAAALKYCSAVLKMLKAGGRGRGVAAEVEGWRAAAEQMEERLKVHVQGAGGGGVAAARVFGDLMSFLDRGARKIVGGGPAATPLAPGVASALGGGAMGDIVPGGAGSKPSLGESSRFGSAPNLGVAGKAITTGGGGWWGLGKRAIPASTSSPGLHSASGPNLVGLAEGQGGGASEAALGSEGGVASSYSAAAAAMSASDGTTSGWSDGAMGAAGGAGAQGGEQVSAWSGGASGGVQGTAGGGSEWGQGVAQAGQVEQNELASQQYGGYSGGYQQDQQQQWQQWEQQQQQQQQWQEWEQQQQQQQQQWGQEQQQQQAWSEQQQAWGEQQQQQGWSQETQAWGEQQQQPQQEQVGVQQWAEGYGVAGGGAQGAQEQGEQQTGTGAGEMQGGEREGGGEGEWHDAAAEVLSDTSDSAACTPLSSSSTPAAAADMPPISLSPAYNTPKGDSSAAAAGGASSRAGEAVHAASQTPAIREDDPLSMAAFAAEWHGTPSAAGWGSGHLTPIRESPSGEGDADFVPQAQPALVPRSQSASAADLPAPGAPAAKKAAPRSRFSLAGLLGGHPSKVSPQDMAEGSADATLTGAGGKAGASGDGSGGGGPSTSSSSASLLATSSSMGLVTEEAVEGLLTSGAGMSNKRSASAPDMGQAVPAKGSKGGAGKPPAAPGGKGLGRLFGYFWGGGSAAGNTGGGGASGKQVRREGGRGWGERMGEEGCGKGSVCWAAWAWQAKLGGENTFYFNEKLKRWVERGKEDEVVETTLAPPPTAFAFAPAAPATSNSADPPATTPAAAAAAPAADGAPSATSALPAVHSAAPPAPAADSTSAPASSAAKPGPPLAYAGSFGRRSAVRSRYVDTFNKGATPALTPAASLLPSIPRPMPAVAGAAATPAAGGPPKFFMPAAPMAVMTPAPAQMGEASSMEGMGNGVESSGGAAVAGGGSNESGAAPGAPVPGPMAPAGMAVGAPPRAAAGAGRAGQRVGGQGGAGAQQHKGVWAAQGYMAAAPPMLPPGAQAALGAPRAPGALGAVQGFASSGAWGGAAGDGSSNGFPGADDMQQVEL